MTTAAENAQRSTLIMASPEVCFAVASDIASYPDWVEEISSVEVLSTTETGFVATAKFTAQSFGRQTTYVLDYDYSQAPNKLTWSLKEGDIVSELSGSYEFSSANSDETEVNYFVSIALSVSLPGFVKRRAEDRLISTALADFKARAESQN